MSQLYTKPTAPACLAALGDVESSLCGAGINPKLSEIRMILLSEVDAAGVAVNAPTDYLVLADWVTAIADTGSGVRRIYGSGDRPRGAEAIITQAGQKIMIQKERIINFNTSEYNSDLQTLFRTMQYGWNGIMWYVTKGNLLYGGQTGIAVNVTHCEDEDAIGDEAVSNWQMKFVFNELISPPSIASPMIVPN
jgi:hypothetical protein